jgi:hypothetical protein
MLGNRPTNYLVVAIMLKIFLFAKKKPAEAGSVIFCYEV